LAGAYALGDMVSKELAEKLRRVKILLLDADGVMTNGKLYFSNSGEITMRFDVRDGSGIRYLSLGGIQTGIITGKRNNAVAHRARDLHISIVHRNVENKVASLNDILKQENLLPEEVAFVGDDLLDLSIMAKVGVSVAVADAAPEVREAADYVTQNRGGDGAVREVCEMILKAQDKWGEVVQHYRMML